MKIELSFLRSKLARRIFWLFVVYAMVPIGLLLFVSLRDVMVARQRWTSSRPSSGW